MNKMQEWLLRAARELGLRVEIGHAVTLSDGRQIVSEAWFPNLACSRGILVFQEDPGSTASRELMALGYGASSFYAPSAKSIFDLQGYAEMFADWGWTGDAADEPQWMIDIRSSAPEEDDE